MNVRLSLLVLAFLLGLLTVTSSAGPPVRAVRAQTAGLTWYVDGNCAVCGDGTMTSPFRTILQSLTFAFEGDTVLVAQGTYMENLFINVPVTLMGGYAATSPTWTRDVAQYETVVASDDRGLPGDWNGDWLGSLSVIKDSSAYRVWYAGGSEMDGERIGYSDSPNGINWFHPLSTPLLESGRAGAWDEAEVANPFVLATDSGFQMWYVGRNAVGERAMGYATSPDALTWQKHDGNPILRPDLADGASFGFPTVARDGPNGYKMWYSGERTIWLATSLDGLSWTKRIDIPALAPGPSGAWDDAQVYAPHVIASASGYEMWYVGQAWTTPEPSIGYAWSEDGLNWTKWPDNPVLSGTMDTWEEGAVASPAVIKEGATDYRMWYRGGTGEQAFGHAASTDGINWVKYGSNPVLMQGMPTQWGSSVVTFGDQSGDAVLDGMTITGGAAMSGGGIYLAGPSVTIRDCRVTGNTARDGGGIYIAAGEPLIENTVVSDNRTVTGWAGGAYIGQASPTISASLIIDNVAKTSGGGLVIWRASPLTPTIIATTVANNVASSGGGILLGNHSALRVYDSRIDSNTAAQMAGVQIDYNNTLAMTNTFVVDNHAVAGGPGAMDFSRSSGRLVNVTIAGNSATDGPGGIAYFTDQPEQTLVIVNSILAFNGVDDVNCSGGACSVTYSNVHQGISGIGNISADPRFVDRTGGDYHLRMNSPAIDAGTSEGAPTTDFEGDSRPMGGVDMGADEFAGDLIDVFLPLLYRNF